MRQPTVHKDLFATNRLVGHFKVGTDTTGKVIGALPKYALPTRVTHIVVTGMTGTGPAVTVGLKDDVDALATSADVAPAATGYKNSANATLAAGVPSPLTEAKEVKLNVTVPGDGGAGEFYTIVEFVFPHELPEVDSFE